MSQGFCKLAYDLLTEVASCPAENIPPFNDDLFRSVIDEIHLQHDRLTTVFNEAMAKHTREAEERGEEPDPSRMWNSSEAQASEVMVYHAAILRNKRLLMAYTKRRLDLLHDLRWSHGTLPEHVKANLTPQELDFSREYSKLLGKYMRSQELGGVGLDLTAGHNPPDEPLVKVRVRRTYGEVMFATAGKIDLKENNSHFLPRDEAQALIMDGVLECVPEGE